MVSVYCGWCCVLWVVYHFTLVREYGCVVHRREPGVPPLDGALDDTRHGANGHLMEVQGGGERGGERYRRGGERGGVERVVRGVML